MPEEFKKQAEKLNELVELYYEDPHDKYLVEILNVSERMIKKAYGKYNNNQYPLEFEEMYSLCFIQLKRSLDKKTFMPEKGKFISFIYSLSANTIMHHHRKYCINKNHTILTNANSNDKFEDGSTLTDYYSTKFYTNDFLEMKSHTESCRFVLLELCDTLTTLETIVLYYFLQNSSYEDIAEKINNLIKYNKSFSSVFGTKTITKKSVDNSICRIKQKAKSLELEGALDVLK